MSIIEYSGWIASDLSIVIRDNKIIIFDRGTKIELPLDTFIIVAKELKAKGCI